MCLSDFKMENFRLIGRITEYKEKLDLYKQQTSQILNTLRDDRRHPVDESLGYD